MKTKEIARKYNIDQLEFEIFIEKNKIQHTYILGFAMQIPDENVETVVSEYKAWTVKKRDEQEKQKEAKKALALAQELAAKEEQAVLAKRRATLANMMVTTGYHFESFKIIKYMEIVSADTVLGTGMFSEFSAGVSDFFGAENDSFCTKIQQARQSAQKKLTLQACEKGANAIIGIDFDYIVLGQNMIGVSVTGTAVIVEKIEEIEEIADRLIEENLEAFSELAK